jgi:hypothetical protein
MFLLSFLVSFSFLSYHKNLILWPCQVYLEDVRELIPEIKPCERPELANAAGYANFAYSALLEEMGIVV